MAIDFTSMLQKKIITADAWQAERDQCGYESVVFTNGCFDILHRGHIEYLTRARNEGDCLVVGLNSDASVRRLKGENRPINQEEDRAMMLAALSCVSYVVVFEEDTPENLIKAINPDRLVKGGDYELEDIVGADFVLKNGGFVQVIPFVEGYSTTNLIKKMSDGDEKNC